MVERIFQEERRLTTNELLDTTDVTVLSADDQVRRLAWKTALIKDSDDTDRCIVQVPRDVPDPDPDAPTPDLPPDPGPAPEEPPFVSPGP